MNSRSTSLAPSSEWGCADCTPRATAEPAADPAIAALIAKLPTPGAEWPADKRVQWLRCIAGIFDLVYRGEDGEIAIVQKPPKGDRNEAARTAA